MTAAGLALIGALALQAQAAPAAPGVLTPCADAASRGISSAVAAICQGDDQVVLAGRHPRGSGTRDQHLIAAADHYRRAATLAPDADTKVRALEALLSAYDTPLLDNPVQMEIVLLEMAAVRPADMTYLYRLAAVQERRELFDLAESTLLTARQRQPHAAEPYRVLAQFYARRASAIHSDAIAAEQLEAPATAPGSPDADGVYRVGAGLAAPQRKGVPRLTPEAAAAGVKGIVVAEITIDAAGRVSDARIIRSVPLLDAEALRTVREWQFEPTVIDGKPVPVKTVVTVDFTR